MHRPTLLLAIPIFLTFMVNNPLTINTTAPLSITTYPRIISVGASVSNLFDAINSRDASLACLWVTTVVVCVTMLSTAQTGLGGMAGAAMLLQIALACFAFSSGITLQYEWLHVTSPGLARTLEECCTKVSVVDQRLVYTMSASLSYIVSLVFCSCTLQVSPILFSSLTTYYLYLAGVYSPNTGRGSVLLGFQDVAGTFALLLSFGYFVVGGR